MKVDIAICLVLRHKVLDKLESVLKMLRFHYIKVAGSLLVQLAVFFPVLFVTCGWYNTHPCRWFEAIVGSSVQQCANKDKIDCLNFRRESFFRGQIKRGSPRIAAVSWIHSLA